ncbi:MAG: deoxyribonuclease IV [Candidatus Dojkabacteria bacterium]
MILIKNEQLMRYLGAHVSASGGLANAIKNGEELEINSVQTMFSAPMRWSAKPIDEKQVESLAAALDTSAIVHKILFHGVYLMNLARQDKQMFHISKISLQSHIEACAKLYKGVKHNSAKEVIGVTFHPGSAKDLTPEEGIARIAYGLDWVAEEVVKSVELPDAMILLESSAGSGSVMGDSLEELAAMRGKANAKAKVGYVLDTQHMFVSGYDWVNELDKIIEQIDSILGLSNVKAFHLNDSMKPFNSHKDRHANLGEGEIGEEAIKRIINHPKLKDKPFFLETPALKSIETTKPEVAKLIEWAA